LLVLLVDAAAAAAAAAADAAAADGTAIERIICLLNVAALWLLWAAWKGPSLSVDATMLVMGNGGVVFSCLER
jgi:hypothetical protein